MGDRLVVVDTRWLPFPAFFARHALEGAHVPVRAVTVFDPERVGPREELFVRADDLERATALLRELYADWRAQEDATQAQRGRLSVAGRGDAGRLSFEGEVPPELAEDDDDDDAL